ncbi:MAG: HAD family hydrolase [Bacillota bacterium]
MHAFWRSLTPSASKGQALRWVIQQMGLAPADILAAGDGQND